MKPPFFIGLLAVALLTGCAEPEKPQPEISAKSNEIVYNNELKKVEYPYYSEKLAEGINFYNLRLSDTPEDDSQSAHPVEVTDREPQPSVVEIYISDNLLEQTIDLTQPIEEELYEFWDYDLKLTWNNFVVFQAYSSLRPEKKEVINEEWVYVPRNKHDQLKSGTLEVRRSGSSFTVSVNAVTTGEKKFSFRYSGTPQEKEKL